MLIRKNVCAVKEIGGQNLRTKKGEQSEKCTDGHDKEKQEEGQTRQFSGNQKFKQ